MQAGSKPCRHWCLVDEPANYPGSESGAHTVGDGPFSRAPIPFRRLLIEHTRPVCGWRGETMPKQKRTRNARTLPVARVLEPNAAGIDIAATEVYVAVPAGRDPQPVRRFSTFTDDLHRLADWLQACRVQSVAMGVHGSVLDSFV